MGLLSLFTRKKEKEKPKRKRSFNAINTGRLFNDWVFDSSYRSQAINADLKHSLFALASRARDLELNNDYAKKFLNMVVDGVIGARGIILQNKAKDESGKLDKLANIKIEEAWSEWSKKGICTVCGRHSLQSFLKLIQRADARDGEVFIRRVKGFNNDFNYALQVIDIMDIDLYKNEYNGDNQIIMGIEVDKWGRAVAYHMRAYNDPEGGTYTEQRIPASEVIHLYFPLYTKQVRGFTWMHSSMNKLKMLEGFEDAALVSARMAAAKMGFITQDTQGDYIGDDVDSEGNIISEVEPGLLEVLPPGYDFKAFDPSSSIDFSEFVKGCLRGAAAGLNVAYTNLSNDLESVNYSSARVGVLDERSIWRGLQNRLIDEVLNVIFDEWLSIQLLTQKITLPMSKFKKFNAPTWQTRGFEWVDPLKDMKANVEAVKIGVTSRSDIAAQHGKDIEEVFEQLSKEKELAEKYNIEISDINKSDILQEDGDE